jgi:arylsulfatase A-like enzyme
VDLYDPGYSGELLDHPPYTWCSKIGATEAEVKHARALYAGEVTLVDTWVGRVLEKIDYCCPDDTAVIFHSDHGFNVGDHERFGKNCQDPEERDWPFFEEVSHGVLMIRLPGGPSGLRHSFLAQSVDLMPTILELAGLPLPDGVKGVSLTPALHSRAMPTRRVALTTQTLNEPTDRVARRTTSITDGTWTLHYRGNEEPWELFNVEEDPTQEINLVRSHREQAQRLHADHLEQLRYAGVRDDVIELRSRLP